MNHARHPDSHAAGTRPPHGKAVVSRRSFVKTLGLSAAGASLAGAAEKGIAAPGTPEDPVVLGPDPVKLTLKVNGHSLSSEIEPGTTLLDFLRIHQGQTGSKEICDRGACGGCSVLVNGALVNSCMMLALDAEGTEVTTVEGLEKGGKLHPVQEAFIRHDALQCGYCTPGLVVAAYALLNEKPKPTIDEIKAGLAGNLCRCGTYTNVFNAVLDASGQHPITDGEGR